MVVSPTIIQQGKFTSDGTAKILQIRSDVDWIEVINYNNAAGAGNDSVFFQWQRGMADGTGLRYYKDGGGDNLNVNVLAAPNGFYLINSSNLTLGAANALTAITAANPPVVTTAATLPATGTLVRFSGLDNQDQVNGIDFVVTASGGGTFTVGQISLSNSTASTAGFWREVPFEPLFYPRNRVITYVRAAASAVIYTSVNHGYVRGQKVRLSFPGGSGLWGDYAALDGLEATITAINSARAGNEPNNALGDNNFTVDVSTAGFTAWSSTFGAATNESYPATGKVPFSPAQVIPVGEDVSYARANTLNELADSVYNTAYLGIKLPAGADAPGGANNDVMYWRAGKSFSVDNV